MSSREVKIDFEKGDNDDESEYTFEDIEDPDHPGSLYTVVLRDEPYRVELKEAPGDLTFDIYGMPKSNATLQVVAGTAQRVLTVDKNSGEVSVQ